ncbi:MAG: S8 family serine peptidase [Luteolibacter sp.]|uniref:S8 family peptidase n=1 Tax=Luteolibacter sp. TaxID=1962973 RepID=UPI003267D9BA
MRRRHLFLVLGFALTALLGYWIADSAAPRQAARVQAIPTEPKRLVVDENEALPKFRRGDRITTYRHDDEATANGALAGQRNVVFKDRAALEDFLKRAGEHVRVMGRLDALNALRVAFLDYDDLASLLDDSQKESLVFPVDVPTAGQGTTQPGAVGLGAGLLDWLGITVDNSAWGAGVRIAILDTGVTSSRAFSSSISAINMVDLPYDLAAQNGHGTAVASMIIGQSSLTPGVAPGSNILSIRIANDFGQSDSFLLAQGIVAAVDGGAQLINISMGSFGDSGLVRDAIEYARAAGALIIAAAGNNGTDQVTYPAANSGVIAVGAVDALGNHLDFSNTGSQISLSAPGFEVNAAWIADQAAKVSGTSFSSPIVTGTIAALMSQPGSAKLTARQAVDLLYSYLNDSGAAGTDTAVGAGMPDIGRVLNGKTPSIYDAAVASQRVIPPSAGNPNGQIEVLVQNRGTETLVNTNVQISTPGGVVNTNITTLPANGVQTIRIPINGVPTTDLRFGSSVSITGGHRDVKPSNDSRVETYVPPVSK